MHEKRVVVCVHLLVGRAGFWCRVDLNRGIGGREVSSVARFAPVGDVPEAWGAGCDFVVGGDAWSARVCERVDVVE